MVTTTTTTTTSLTATMFGRRSLVSALLIGLGVGVVGWLLTIAFRNYIVEPVFCRSADTFAICNNGGTVAWIAAHIIVAIASVLALVRAGVYRPLLVVLAAFIALWGIGSWLAPLAWYWGVIWQGALFALAYALFAWLASVERFVIGIVATVVMIIVIRLLGAL